MTILPLHNYSDSLVDSKYSISDSYYLEYCLSLHWEVLSETVIDRSCGLINTAISKILLFKISCTFNLLFNVGFSYKTTELLSLLKQMLNKKLIYVGTCSSHQVTNNIKIQCFFNKLYSLNSPENLNIQKQNDIFIIFHYFVFKLNVQYKNTVLPLLVLLSG